MDKPAERIANKAIDSIQQRLTSYACELHYEGLPGDVIHAAKVRVIDTLGALIAGFYGAPCRIARNLAAQMPHPNGATVIGTRMKTTLDMAAFVNATTSRYPELTDSYRNPGSALGHPSDIVTPLLGMAEHTKASGREFITSVVLGYEVFLRISDIYHNIDPVTGDIIFDHTNFTCIGSAIAAGKLLGLSPSQFSHCISMAVVPNVILRQVRKDYVTMFKAATSGHASRAGIFAALLAAAGMEGPHLPFEGAAGWCKHVAGERFSLDAMGGSGTPFKILSTIIKPRACAGSTIACVLAAEKIAPLKNLKEVRQITVEVPEKTKIMGGTGEANWNPDTREGADHSAPYVVAATLIDGTVTLRSFNDAHLRNPELRALMQKIEIVANDEFTKAYDRVPVEHRTRVTIIMNNGERLVGEAGGDKGDMVAKKSDAQIVEKFRGLTEDVFSAKQLDSILNRLWHLEELKDVAEIPPAFVIA